MDGVKWAGKGLTSPLPPCAKKHNLSFGSATGLEPESVEYAAGRSIPSPDAYWWDPRGQHPRAELLVSFLEDPEFISQCYEHFVPHIDEPRYTEFDALRNMSWYIAKDFTHR